MPVVLEIIKIIISNQKDYNLSLQLVNDHILNCFGHLIPFHHFLWIGQRIPTTVLLSTGAGTRFHCRSNAQAKSLTF